MSTPDLSREFPSSLGNVLFYGAARPTLLESELRFDRKRCVIKAVLLIAAACFVFYAMLRMSTQLTYCPTTLEYTKGHLGRNIFVVACQILASIIFVPTSAYGVHQALKTVDITKKLPELNQVKAE